MPAGNWGGSRVVGVTKDLGKTWEKHPTNRTPQLKEPVCQGSLLAVDGVPGAGRVVLFSNPNTTSGRSHMTLKASTDDAGLLAGGQVAPLRCPQRLGLFLPGRPWIKTTWACCMNPRER